MLPPAQHHFLIYAILCLYDVSGVTQHNKQQANVSGMSLRAPPVDGIIGGVTGDELAPFKPPLEILFFDKFGNRAAVQQYSMIRASLCYDGTASLLVRMCFCVCGRLCDNICACVCRLAQIIECLLR